MADMRLLFGLIILVFLVGCLGAPPAEGNETTQQGNGQATVLPQENQSVVQDTTTNAGGTTQPGTQDTGTGQPDTDTTQDTTPTTIATSQADCSTLAADCESCLAKSGCNWCKDTNACYYEGIVPTISSCSPNAWATTVSECKLVEEAESCSQFTNCADCLSGTGCQWCIQGSVCAGAGTSQECFGGWMTESYQCNYASR